MSYKNESNKNIGFLLISIGLLALFSGIDNIFNIDEYKPDFHGRWGWFTYFLYSEFGVYGQPVYMVFGGGVFFVFWYYEIKIIRSPVGWGRSIERNPTIEDQGAKYTNT